MAAQSPHLKPEKSQKQNAMHLIRRRKKKPLNNNTMWHHFLKVQSEQENLRRKRVTVQVQRLCLLASACSFLESVGHGPRTTTNPSCQESSSQLTCTCALETQHQQQQQQLLCKGFLVSHHGHYGVAVAAVDSHGASAPPFHGGEATRQAGGDRPQQRPSSRVAAGASASGPGRRQVERMDAAATGEEEEEEAQGSAPSSSRSGWSRRRSSCSSAGSRTSACRGCRRPSTSSRTLELHAAAAFGEMNGFCQSVGVCTFGERTKN
uniref:Uncharacterized protein n=1 Tax=Oryza brachyantha TaxID=4533 RepID=J3LD31_ORYBR